MTDLLTTAEVARLLGVSPSRISQKVASGQLTPSVKMPGKRGAFLFDAEHVREQQEAS